MTTTLVLGATGFIGGHVALAALDRGWKVRGLRRLPTPAGPARDAPVEWFTGDLGRPETLAEALQGVDIVFHAAGYYPTSGGRVAGHVARGVRQTRIVLDAVARAGARRFVYTSSLSTIGLPPAGEQRLADERDQYLPGSVARSAYYECKYAMESEVLRAAAAGLPALALNPTAVLGPGDAKPTTGGVLLAVARGLGIVSVPLTVNIIDVRDVAAAHVRAAEVGEVGERTILGGANVTVPELMATVASLAGVAPPRLEVPRGLVHWLASFVSALPGAGRFANHLLALDYWQAYSCQKAQRELGLAVRPLEETLREALVWYAQHGFLPPQKTVV
jgi:dihydroflavonol-4-reductase